MEEGWPDTVWAECWHGVNHRPICPDSYSHHNGSQLEFQIVRPDGQSRVETKTWRNIMTIVKKKTKKLMECLSTIWYWLYFKAFFGQFASLSFVSCSTRGTKGEKHLKGENEKQKRGLSKGVKRPKSQYSPEWGRLRAVGFQQFHKFAACAPLLNTNLINWTPSLLCADLRMETNWLAASDNVGWCISTHAKL